MYDYFKYIAILNSCSLGGVCSIHPSVNSLYELFLHEIKEISNYLVKLNEFQIQNPEAMSFCIEILSVFMIDTSFNQDKYLELIKKLYSLKLEIKNKYTNYCKENKLPCEVLNSDIELKDGITINELINISQENISNSQKKCDKTKLGLFETVIIFARLTAINISKIKKLDKTFNRFDFELIRFFALTSASSIKNEKIKRRICDFSKTAFEIKKVLNETYEKFYGQKTDARVQITPSEGHCILVSGDDIDELSDLLKAIEIHAPNENINVYTNGTLFLAHLYPYFQNNKFLKGHWGKGNAEYDFSLFPGAILITKNFIQKIDSLYRGELFSNKLISTNKISDIKDKDYGKIINSALKSEGFLKEEEKEYVDINYKKEEILSSIDEIIDRKAAIIVGVGNESEEVSKQYKNHAIINLNFAYEAEFIEEIITKLEVKNIEITVFFAQCNLISMENILFFINRKINLLMLNCPHAFINPHIINSLKDDFGIQII